jgi:hypothetical protein
MAAGERLWATLLSSCGRERLGRTAALLLRRDTAWSTDENVIESKAAVSATRLASIFVACAILCAFGRVAIASDGFGQVTLRLEPLAAVVKEGEEIGMKVVFIGGAQETILTLPMGADPSGIISYRVTEIASLREWTAVNRDSRSFAADAHRRIPAGGRLEQDHDVLEFRGQNEHVREVLPAGTYRIVVTYDEGRTFRPENRTSRVLRSEPVEIVVTAR